MARRRYTEEQKAEALKLYETHGPTAVQKKLGIPKGTTARWARAAGVGTVRNQKTSAALEAATLDAAAVRATVSGNTIRAADHAAAAIVQRLEAEALTIPLRELATVYGILIDKHVLLARLDNASDDYAAVDAWLNHIIDGSPGKMQV